MFNEHLEPLGNDISVYVNDKHRFSTDTILLANFSFVKGSKKCVELGTGCAAIPLLWCRHNKNLKIFAVEIQHDACVLAQKSVDYNGLNENIKIINENLNNLNGILPYGSFDVVVCNPPYKLSGCGITNFDTAKHIARHEKECTLDDICRTASKLLQFGGKLCICQRPERLADAMELMRKYDIEPKVLRLVQARISKPPKLFLLEGRRGGNRGFLQVKPTLLIEDGNGNFSAEMNEIYGCFKNLDGKEIL